MAISAIEIVFDECGWVYNPKEDAWRLANFKVDKKKLKAALDEGKDVALREKIIETIRSVKSPNKDDLARVEATIERLKIKNKT